jgi:hypothetical protein
VTGGSNGELSKGFGVWETGMKIGFAPTQPATRRLTARQAQANPVRSRQGVMRHHAHVTLRHRQGDPLLVEPQLDPLDQITSGGEVVA